MPTDLDLNSDKDIHLDSANDLATTSGQAQVEQSVGLDVLNVIRDFIGNKLNGTQVGLLEERARESLQSDEQVGQVQEVNLVEFDRRDNSIKLEIIVIEDSNFTLEVSG